VRLAQVEIGDDPHGVRPSAGEGGFETGASAPSSTTGG
jgi:hypothetical protein